MSNVQLKGNNPADPWWVIEGTPGEIVQQIAQVFPDLYTDQPQEFPSTVAKARELWAAQVTVGNTLGGTEIRHEVAPTAPAAQPGFAPAPPQSAPPAQAAPGLREESDRYGNRYEHGRPDAPQTQYGAAVLKYGTSQAGKQYKRWIDPRDPSIPSVRQAHGPNKPADLWPGEWGPR